MKKKLFIFTLLVILVSPNISTFADKAEEVSDDIGYEDGLYIMPVKTISSTKGLQKNPYGESLSGKLNQEEKKEILEDTNIKELIKLYNSTYRLAIRWYKYGLEHMDRWKEVKNLTDPVFGSINKETWVKVYEDTIISLQEVRLYFDHLGLVDEDYTEKETLDMIDSEDLKFKKIRIDN
ncbi:hypothetical protein JNO63_03765 [Anaerococcus sp. mt242]|uniref:hypothetical protein n=1 Tax=Anaerococcus sp. mt242 TaxID=2661917 RepID=UPI00193430EA|nr:hypothetical protein [Anaerococcus sp. mt242]MBM0046204.1 hypothetical protein [Anaerococcus sp. mt242]